MPFHCITKNGSKSKIAIILRILYLRLCNVRLKSPTNILLFIAFALSQAKRTCCGLASTPLSSKGEKWWGNRSCPQTSPARSGSLNCGTSWPAASSTRSTHSRGGGRATSCQGGALVHRTLWEKVRAGLEYVKGFYLFCDAFRKVNWRNATFAQICGIPLFAFLNSIPKFRYFLPNFINRLPCLTPNCIFGEFISRQMEFSHFLQFFQWHAWKCVRVWFYEKLLLIAMEF